MTLVKSTLETNAKPVFVMAALRVRVRACCDSACQFVHSDISKPTGEYT